LKILSTILIILITTISSCKKINSKPTINYDVNLGKSLVLEKVTINSKIGNTVSLTVDAIYLIDVYTFGQGNQGQGWFDTLELHDENSAFYQLDSISRDYNESYENYSLAIILDKNMNSGGGVKYTDGLNYSITESIKDGNECMLVGSVRDNSTTPCKFYTNGFMREMNSEHKNAIFNLCSEQIEGSNSMYDAIDKTMDKMIQSATFNNKFWDNEDDGLGINLDQLITKALANNIHISFFRWVYSNLFIFDTVEISTLTGGFNGNASSIARMNTNLFSLHKLLSKRVTRTKFHLKLNSVLIPNSNSWNGYLTVDFSQNLPFYIDL